MNSMMGKVGLGGSGMGNRGNTGSNVGQTATGFQEKRPHGYQYGAMQQFTPEQMELFQSLFQHLSPDSYLSRLAGGDQDLFNEMEAPALRNFNNTIAGIGNRYSSMGLGAQKSSGFQNEQSTAASNFQQDLASRRQALQQNAIKELMGLSGDLLGQRPVNRFLVQKDRGGTGTAEILGKFAGAIPGTIGGMMGGNSFSDSLSGGLKGGLSSFGGFGG